MIQIFFNLNVLPRDFQALDLPQEPISVEEKSMIDAQSYTDRWKFFDHIFLALIHQDGFYKQNLALFHDTEIF